MSERITPRRLQAEETKKRIYKSALQLFKEKDFEDVTIALICKNAGVSTGHFYNYFESKEALLLSQYPAFDDLIRNEFIYKKHESYIGAIKDLIYQQTAGAERVGSELFSQMLRLQLRLHGQYVLEEDRYINAYLEKLITGAIKEGSIDPSYEPKKIAKMILRQSRGVLLNWSMSGGTYEIAKVAVEDLTILLNGLKPV